MISARLLYLRTAHWLGFPAKSELFRLELAQRGFPVTPETHRLVFSRADGSVGVTQPTHEVLYYLTGPGGFWNDQPPGFTLELFLIKTNPALQNGYPCSPQAARDFILGMQRGGRSWQQAWHIIGQHDCARQGGLAIEIQHIDQLPKSRAHRNAWRRSPNGGPIYIDERIARVIDERRNAA